VKTECEGREVQMFAFTAQRGNVTERAGGNGIKSGTRTCSNPRPMRCAIGKRATQWRDQSTAHNAKQRRERLQTKR
jgi:hypothetical protein